jgi:hypothetical protein
MLRSHCAAHVLVGKPVSTLGSSPRAGFCRNMREAKSYDRITRFDPTAPTSGHWQARRRERLRELDETFDGNLFGPRGRVDAGCG